jgi:hypothetical protein
MDLIAQLNAAPFWMILGAASLYLARQLLEGRLKSEFTRTEKLVESSLGLKKGLREKEQDALLAFREAVENWEYFLQSGIGDLTIKSELGNFEPADFHEADRKAYGAVRMAAVKASVLLRSRELEVELLQTIGAIRALYYPLVQTTVSQTLALQEQIAPYSQRMKLFGKKRNERPLGCAYSGRCGQDDGAAPRNDSSPRRLLCSACRQLQTDCRAALRAQRKNQHPRLSSARHPQD